MNLLLPVTRAHSSPASPIAVARSYIEAFATSMPYSSHTKLWNSNSAWSVPWLTSA